MRVFWSKKAEEVYNQYIDQTIEKFSTKLAEKFAKDVDSLLEKIKSDNEICPQSKKKHLRKCVVSVNISMIYKLSTQRMDIVTFIFNRSAHKY